MKIKKTSTLMNIRKIVTKKSSKNKILIPETSPPGSLGQARATPAPGSKVKYSKILAAVNNNLMQKLSNAIFTGVGVAGVFTAGATIYNTNETNDENERMHKETIESNERIEMAKIESNERIEMEKLEVAKYQNNLSSKYDQQNFNNNVESEAIYSSNLANDNNPSEFDDSTLVNSDELNNDELYEINSEFMETENTSFEESNVSVAENENFPDNCVINSALETDYLNTNFNNILQSAGFSFACFAFIGLYVGLSLGFNLIILHYGKKIDNLPKWLQTLFLYYSKYLLVQNSILLLFLIGSQTISLLLGLYLLFFGA